MKHCLNFWEKVTNKHYNKTTYFLPLLSWLEWHIWLSHLSNMTKGTMFLSIFTPTHLWTCPIWLCCYPIIVILDIFFYTCAIECLLVNSLVLGWLIPFTVGWKHSTPPKNYSHKHKKIAFELFWYIWTSRLEVFLFIPSILH